MRSRNRHVAQRRQHIAAADGVAPHLRDYRLGHVANDRVQFLDRHADGSARLAVAIGAVMIRLIAAGAKRLVASAGQHDRADLLVPARLQKSVNQFDAGAGAERVIDLRAIDGDGRDAIFLVVQNVFVVHENPRQPCIERPPETLIVWPVMKLASSLRKNATMPG